MTEILPGEPPIFETLYDYAPWSRSGRVVFLAAQIATTGPSTLLAVGRCGEAVGFEEACAAARLAARQSLAWLARASETGERIMAAGDKRQADQQAASLASASALFGSPPGSM